ncbi:hypothetical protein [[Clostridium] dakarense]|uniref:hypothetical protein n=1 Tax=Faecalimicrobium dakarense TaxID=1301100 RepID=UPI0004B54631|nr:hypothetical protein [[Clostridium] dakarense]
MSDKDSKIQWLGLDGFLVILFPIVVFIIWYAVQHQIDFIIGKVVPYGTILVVIAILFKYFKEVMQFSKPMDKSK